MLITIAALLLPATATVGTGGSRVDPAPRGSIGARVWVDQDHAERSTVSHRGVNLALLGIDGIGKTTLAAEIEGLCRETGQPVTRVSWRQYLTSQPGGSKGYPAQSLENLWLEAFRLYYGGASVSGRPLELPGSYRAVVDGDVVGQLGQASVSDMRASGPFAAAFVELSAHVLLHHEVVQPLLDRGHIVLQESYGYKSVVKNLVACARLSREWEDDAERSNLFARALFGQGLRPDVGIYLSGDPSTALKWRTRQRGGPSVFESLSTSTDDPTETFLAVQSECARNFDSFAREYGWMRIVVTDSPRSVNMARTLEKLRMSEIWPRLGLT